MITVYQRGFRFRTRSAGMNKSAQTAAQAARHTKKSPLIAAAANIEVRTSVPPYCADIPPKDRSKISTVPIGTAQHTITVAVNAILFPGFEMKALGQGPAGESAILQATTPMATAVAM